MKSGILTSEFWVTVAGLVCVILNDKLGLNLPRESVAAIIIAIVAYVTSRSGVKKKEAVNGEIKPIKG